MSPEDPSKHKNGAAHVAPESTDATEDIDDETAEAAADEADAPPDTRDAPAPPVIAELAAACARFVAAKYKVPLDFEPETLSLLDHYATEARADIEAKPDTLGLLQASIGAYLGEVMRRAFGATWFCEGEHDGWRLDFTYVYLTFNPIGMAREGLLLHDEDGWHAHLETDPAETEMLKERFATLGEAEESDYFAPSTRFDLTEIAVDTLRARMEQEGNGDVTFGPDDYRQR